MSFLTGYFHPSQPEFRDIYGNGNPQIFLLSVKIKNNFYFSTGYELINLKGRAVGEREEEYPLKFKMRSIPISIFYKIRLKRISIALGAGFNYNSFEEKWETIPVQYSSSEKGYLGFANLEIPLLRKLSFVSSIRFERIYSEESAFSKGIDLGGLKALFGILIKVI